MEKEVIKAKGPPGYCFWAAMFAVSVLTLSNFFMMITVYKVLHLSTGMESVEVDPDHRMTTFYDDVTVDSVAQMDGEIKGFSDEPFHIEGDDGDVIIKVQPSEDKWRVDPKVEFSQDTISLADFERMDIKDENGQSVFSTKLPQFGLPSGVQRLTISSATANRVISPRNSSLIVKSDANIRFKGNEGISVSGREMFVMADQDISLHSINGSIVISGAHGIVLDVKQFPTSIGNDERSSVESYEENVNTIPRPGPAAIPLGQFKLCICMPGGKLFRIPIPVGNGESSGSARIGCQSVDLESNKNNPCM